MQKGRIGLRSKRAHPYTIFTYLLSLLFWILIPIMQSLLFDPVGAMEHLMTTALNITAVGIIVFFAIKKYRSIFYRAGNRRFLISQGFLIKRKSSIPYEYIHSISISENIIPGIFGAKNAKINSSAPVYKKSDVSLWLPRNEDIALRGVQLDPVYTCSMRKALLMAVTWSNAALGLLILAPLINKAGKIWGSGFSDKLYKSFDVSTYFAAVGIPPLAAGLAGLFTVGFAVSVTVIFFRYARFSSNLGSGGERIIVIKRGIINRHTFITKQSKINAAEIRQSLVMRLLKIGSVYLHTIGSGASKGDKSLLSAPENEAVAEGILKQFLELCEKKGQKIKPGLSRVFSYILLPLVFFAVTCILGYLIYRIGFFGEAAKLFFIFSASIIIVWVIFRIEALKAAALSCDGNTVVICYFKRLNITKAFIPVPKIQFLKVRRSFFQKKAGTCSLSVYIFSSRGEKFIIKHVDYKATEELIEGLRLTDLTL